MPNQNHCPKCNCENTYPDSNLWNCPECFYEWNPSELAGETHTENQVTKILDSNGNELNTGDSIVVIKDLKVKGSAAGLKAGTKIKNIRIVDGQDGHHIACKVDGIGAMFLKSEFVKKA